MGAQLQGLFGPQGMPEMKYHPEKGLTVQLSNEHLQGVMQQLSRLQQRAPSGPPQGASPQGMPQQAPPQGPPGAA